MDKNKALTGFAYYRNGRDEKQAAEQAAPESTALVTGNNSFQKFRNRKCWLEVQAFPFLPKELGLIGKGISQRSEYLPIDKYRRQSNRRNYKKQKHDNYELRIMNYELFF
jgi:hypothetical protein